MKSVCHFHSRTFRRQCETDARAALVARLNLVIPSRNSLEALLNDEAPVGLSRLSGGFTRSVWEGFEADSTTGRRADPFVFPVPTHGGQLSEQR